MWLDVSTKDFVNVFCEFLTTDYNLLCNFNLLKINYLRKLLLKKKAFINLLSTYTHSLHPYSHCPGFDALPWDSL